MQIVFIRHGEKLPLAGHPDEEWPLSAGARDATGTLRGRLQREGIHADAYLTSRFCHAVETATILRGPADDVPVVIVEGLTPHTDEARFSLSAIAEDAVAGGVDVPHVTTVALVGHEDRLSNLARQLTADPVERLEKLEVLVLKAESLQAALAGRATVDTRFSVR
jgi:phosphohistidine phosphatase SixA